jgi:hypothetical protein
MNVLNNGTLGLIADHRPERSEARDWLRYPKNPVERVLAVPSALQSRSRTIEREIRVGDVRSADIVHSRNPRLGQARALADGSAAFRI